MLIIIVIKQHKDDEIRCVCLCLSSLFLFARSTKLVLCCVNEGHIRLCLLGSCAHRYCVRRGTGALLRQTQETSLSERESERGPLSCDSAFHQGAGRERHKTRHASPLFPIQPPPHLSVSDLNIYQRAPRWNSSSASVSR